MHMARRNCCLFANLARKCVTDGSSITSIPTARKRLFSASVIIYAEDLRVGTISGRINKHATTLKIFDYIKSRISKRLKRAKKEASEFYKKYFVFTSKEIIDEFNSVFKYLGHKKGIVDFSTYAYLQNQKDSKIKMTVKDFKAETAKRHGKDYDFEKDDTSEYKIYFSICENDKFSHTQLLYELPLDFDMKLTDSTKLEDHLTTKVTAKKRNLRGEPTEYHTELMVKPSAYDKFIVPLDFTKIDSTQTIVREVYNKLMSKVRLREIAREDRARAQSEKELSL